MDCAKNQVICKMTAILAMLSAFDLSSTSSAEMDGRIPSLASSRIPAGVKVMRF